MHAEGGLPENPTDTAHSADSAERPERTRSRRSAAAVFLLVAVYGAVLVRHRSESLGGSDSTGYFNLARALAAGEPVQAIEPLGRLGFSPDDAHLFIPLGYVPGPRPGTMSTFYPPGLPLQIMAAAVFGWFRGPFLLSPFFSAVSVLLLYLVARALGVGRGGAFCAAAALAASPVLAFQGVQLMSDTAALAWALATMLFALKARERVGWSVAAGFAFGVGVLVRPASALLILPLIFAMPGSLRAWVLFGTGGAPCAGFLLWFDRISYGSALKTGYGAGGALSDFAFGNFPARFRHYLSWTSAMMTPLVPAGWLLLPGDSRRSPRVRAMLFLWFGAFFVFYCFYGPYETWWYTRYLLPAYPAAILGAVMVAEDLLRRIRERAGADERHALRVARISTAAGVLAAIAICGAGVRVGAKFHVLQTANGQAVYPEAIRWASAIVPERSAVLAMEFSGAMRAYRWGTFVRWDYIEAPRFPEIRRRLEERGYGVYALVFPHEVREAAPRVPGSWTYRGSYREVSLWRLEPLSGR